MIDKEDINFSFSSRTRMPAWRLFSVPSLDSEAETIGRNQGGSSIMESYAGRRFGSGRLKSRLVGSYGYQ